MEDALTEVLQEGARQMLAAAIEAEVSGFLERFQTKKMSAGLSRMVRNGRLPGRTISDRDRGYRDVGATGSRAGGKSPLQFIESAAVSAPHQDHGRMEKLLPGLYLKGISTGNVQEALTVLWGTDAPGLSASTISRLKENGKDEQQCWLRRDLSNRRYVYLWVDGIHFGVRLEGAARCRLVVVGATAEGKKELVA